MIPYYVCYYCWLSGIDPFVVLLVRLVETCIECRTLRALHPIMLKISRPFDHVQVFPRSEACFRPGAELPCSFSAEGA